MTVELNARFISELNESYPRQGDLLKEGDDHMRLIKACLKQTLPSFNKTVNISADKLNYFDGMTSFTSDTMTFNGNLSVGENKAISLGSNVLKNAGDPVDDQDLVTKKYLSTVVGSLVYPVGAIYIATTDANPSAVFGGTWVQFAQGRVIVGVGSTKDTTGTAKLIGLGEESGEFSHVLTEAETAHHAHGFSGWTDVQGHHAHNIRANGYEVVAYIPGGHGTTSGGPYSTATVYAEGAGEHSHNVGGTIAGAGGGAAHNNMQPYIGCYIWKRTA